MKKSEFRQLIREEIKNTLNESMTSTITDSLGNPPRVAYLYQRFGVFPKYNPNVEATFGQETVDTAVEMAPKLKKLQEQLRKLLDTPEGQMLMYIAMANNEHSGRDAKTYISTVVDDILY